jgi:hypothetical protein
MTIDLNEHMKKKTQEKHIKAYDAMAKAMDGLTVGTVLHITSAFVASVMSQLDGPARMQAAMTFYAQIAEDKPDAGAVQ